MTWQQTSESSNVTFYADRTLGKHYPWAEVVTNNLAKRDGKWVTVKVPTYYIHVYRNSQCEVGQFKYEPKTSGGYRLSARTVGRLVNAFLDKK